MSVNTEGNKKALPVENVQANMKYEDAVSIVQHTPREYFVCVGDSDCTLVQGLCMGVAVNRQFSDKYKMAIAIFYKINNQAMSCPTDRQPAYSRAVCTHERCSIIYGKSGQ